MGKQRVIALYGDSLLMDTVEASLGKKLEMGVVRIHTTVPNAVERLKALHPDLVILDLDAPDSQFVLAFFKEQPNVPLLCLDVTSSQVLALSCQHYTVPTANDLTRIIDMQTATRHSGGNGRGNGNGHGLYQPETYHIPLVQTAYT